VLVPDVPIHPNNPMLGILKTVMPGVDKVVPVVNSPPLKLIDGPPWCW